MAPRAGKPPRTDQPNPPPAEPGNDHNKGPLTQDQLDDLFVVHLSQARKDNDALEKAMEMVRAARKVRTRNRNTCRTDGFPLKQLDEILADEALAPSDVEEREAKRLRMRGVAGLPGGSQAQMDLFAAAATRDAVEGAHWRKHGFMVGQRGLDQDPTKHGVPGDMIDAWEEQRREGQAKLAKAWFTKHELEGVPIPDDIPVWNPDTESVGPSKDQEFAAAAPETEPA